jgi:hypothetical protein
MHETHMHAWQAVFEALETSQRTQSDRSTHRMRQTRRVLLPVRAVVSHTAGRGDDRTQGTGCNNDKPTQGAPALLCRIVAAARRLLPRGLSLSVSRLYSRLCHLCSARVHAQTKPGIRKLSQIANAFQGGEKETSRICRVRQTR